MSKFTYIAAFCWLFCALPLMAQPPEKKSRSARQERGADPLEQAREEVERDPQRAVFLLQQVVRESQGSTQALPRLVQAYFLLGKVNESIEQPELALERYEQALHLLKTHENKILKAELQYRVGRLWLQQEAFEEAADWFRQCVEQPEQSWPCREGLAHSLAGMGQLQESLDRYEELLQHYRISGDSLGVARIEARRSTLFAEQKQMSEAQRSYFNSLQTYPSSNRDYEDYQPLEEAGQKLIEQAGTEEERRALQETTRQKQTSRSLVPEAQVNTNLQLADRLLEDEEFEKAERYIEASQKVLEDLSLPKQKAEVLKRASALSLKKGAYEKALTQYQAYMEENEKVLREKAQQLDQQIEVVREQGAIDRIVSDYQLAATQQALMENQIFYQRLTIGILLLLLLVATMSLLLIARNVRRRKRANRLLQLKSLRTQMNPHFLFNALNSVNQFIAQQDERTANRFLADFAGLMRKVLEFSKEEFITFEEEWQLLQLYLKLEHLRFRDHFEYQLIKDPSVPGDTPVPPLLLQPLAENAIWHGLRYKETPGRFHVEARQLTDGRLRIILEDNGIGRKRSGALKTTHQERYKSTGLQNLQHRLQLLKTLYGQQIQIEIDDLFPEREETGTRVTIILDPPKSTQYAPARD